MGAHKYYEEINECKEKKRFNKRTVWFLSIGCPILSLVVLCTYNIWVIHQEYTPIDKGVLLRWNKEYGGFIYDYYLSGKTYQLFNEVIEEDFITNGTNIPDPPTPSEEVCSAVVEQEKFDCYPRGSVTKDECTKRGCCYIPSSENIPTCFYPPAYRTYTYTSINRTESSVIAEMKVNYKSPYPSTSPSLTLQAQFIRNHYLLIEVSSSKGKEDYPDIFNTRRDLFDEAVPNNVLYDFKIDPDSVGFEVIRKSNNVSIFDSRDIGGFIYSDQFIQISTKLPCKNLYGLGEGRTNLPLKTNWTVRTLWNHDTVPTEGLNGYGSYPMYLCTEGNGLAHVSVFGNQYSTDFILQPGSLTYRTIGTPLVIAFFLGPTPLAAVQQANLDLSLNSYMPPYWSLGFHLCRFGYKSLEDLELVWNKTRAAGIPHDTQWADIDYMKNRNDFTLDPSFKNLGTFVKILHQVGMHFIPILDPGVSGSEPKGSYPPYDRGMELGIFVKDAGGKNPIVGKVWNPKTTVFPDFSHPKALPYWIELLKQFHTNIPFDGLWIDMNEPSNFVNGSLSGCPKNNLEEPPYVPAVHGGTLNYLTLCMSAKHHLGSHYMMHNLFGLFEAIVSSFALSQIREERPFVITRSSTLTLGKYAGHWTGDVISTWDDMAQSVKDIIHMSMYGVNMVGADICGFNGNTTASLCKRWQQLGAFYPFSRNHNSDDAIAQDPVSLGIEDSTKKALLLRYSLLPYLYTQFWLAKSEGLPVIRPMFYLFPKEKASYSVDTQFMWGDGLLIVPVLTESITYVKAFLGKSIWYDIYTFEKTISNSSQRYVLPAPEDTIPVLIRGGTILPMQEPNVTTTLSRRNPFFLKVALNESNEASGILYWDDGKTIAGDYSVIYFGVTNKTLMSCNAVTGYNFDLFINKIEIFSLSPVKNVTVNEKATPFSYNATSQVLVIDNLQLLLQKDFNVTWA